MNILQGSESKQSTPEIHLGAGDVFYGKFVSLMVRRTELWKHVCDFARWVEYDAAPLAIQKNQDEIWIDLDSDANIERLWIGEVEDYEILLRHRILWKYLVSLGIHKLCLDPRLEMNQIQDFLVFIKSFYKIRIKMTSGIFINEIYSTFNRPGFFIRALSRQRIKNIGYCNNSGS